MTNDTPGYSGPERRKPVGFLSRIQETMDVAKFALWLLTGAAGLLVGGTVWYMTWGSQISSNKDDIKAVEKTVNKLDTKIETKIDPVVASTRLELTQAQNELHQLHIDMVSVDQRLVAQKNVTDAWIAEEIKIRREMDAADAELRMKIAVYEEKLRGALEHQTPLPFDPPRRR